MHFVYAIHDKKAEMFLNPVIAHADAVVLRQFEDLAFDKDLPIGRYPEDFELCRIGTYNENSGEIKSIPIKVISQATEFFVTPTDSPSENVISEVKPNENFQ